ncbi:hypothetical protein IEQ34_001246 [Dendrobium chrysotoxum]|uniref:Uncharacterized protein n=1 Tax=Dendrobium chrysotoxum TaxID=161865 RepID=A0AAV7HPZ3_DENCH|nr:hypothetical protein IEQ34_001246 [Dendrobium chrysotoxum]
MNKGIKNSCSSSLPLFSPSLSLPRSSTCFFFLTQEFIIENYTCPKICSIFKIQKVSMPLCAMISNRLDYRNDC